MGCKLSMPLRSLRGPAERHEKLDEDDERYFLKVQARNKSSFQLEWRGFGSDSPIAGVTNTEPLDLTENDSTDDAEIAPASAGHAVKDNKQEESHNALVVATDTPVFAMTSNLRKMGVASKRRLERSRSPLNAAASPSSRQSFDSWSSAGESQFDTASDVSSEVFDALLPSGMIWEVVQRTGKVTAVAVSNSKTADDAASQQEDERLLLAIGTDDGKVCVVEVRDERHAKNANLRQTEPHSHERLRNLGSSQEVSRKGKIRSLDFSSDGRLLAVAGDDCIVSIYRILFQAEADNNELAGLELAWELERVDRIYAARFSPNDEFLAVGGFDSIVTVAAVSWGQEKLELQVVTEIHRPGLILCLDWRPDGEVLAIGSTDKCAVVVDKVWRVVGEIPRVASVECVKWSPDGSKLAIVCGDTVAVAKAENLEVVGEIEHRDRSQLSKGLYEEFNNKSQRRPWRVFSVCWSPDGNFIALGGSDGCCELVESRGLTRVHEIRRLRAITSLAWGEKQLASGDCARYLAIGGEDNCVAILKAGIDFESSSIMEDASSTASSSYLSTGSRSRQEWVFKEGSFSDVDDNPRDSGDSIGVAAACQKVTCMAFSRGSKSKASPYFAFATDGCFVSITTTRKWESIARLEFVKPIRSIQFANTNNLLVLGGDDAMVYVVSVSSQKLIAEKLVSAPISALGFSWGDERLAVASVDGLLALLDPQDDFEVVGEIDSSDATIVTLDWSSKNLGIGRVDGSVALHDTDKVFGNFFVPQVELRKRKAIRSLAFGVSGRFLAVGGDDGKLSVYSEKGDWVLCHQVRIDSTVTSVNWSPTGRYLAYCATSISQICKVIDTVVWVEVNEIQLALRTDDSSVDLESTCLSWNADGSSLTVGTANHGILILETSQWKLVVALKSKLNS